MGEDEAFLASAPSREHCWASNVTHQKDETRSDHVLTRTVGPVIQKG